MREQLSLNNLLMNLRVVHLRVKLEVSCSGHQPANFAQKHKATGMLMEFYLLSILKRARQSIATVMYPNWCVARRKSEKDKLPLFPKQCTVWQVDNDHGKSTQITLRVASTLTIFTRLNSYRRIPVRRLQKSGCKDKFTGKVWKC